MVEQTKNCFMTNYQRVDNDKLQHTAHQKGRERESSTINERFIVINVLRICNCHRIMAA